MLESLKKFEIACEKWDKNSLEAKLLPEKHSEQERASRVVISVLTSISASNLKEVSPESM